VIKVTVKEVKTSYLPSAQNVPRVKEKKNNSQRGPCTGKHSLQNTLNSEENGCRQSTRIGRREKLSGGGKSFGGNLDRKTHEKSLEKGSKRSIELAVNRCKVARKLEKGG